MRRWCASAILVLALGGCGEAMHGWHQAYDPLAPVDGPIRRMSETNETYRNLSVVPARPTDVPTYEARQAKTSDLERDRAAGRAAAEALRADGRLIDPTAVPAP